MLARYSRQPWFVVQCSTCGFVYLRNSPTYEQIGKRVRLGKNAGDRKAAPQAPKPFTPSARREDAMENRASRRLTRASIQASFPLGRVLDVLRQRAASTGAVHSVWH